MAENVRAHVVVSGRVQGVGFRYDAQWAAQGIGVSGWVRNRRDGTVEAVIEGEKQRVERMLAWCRRGPALARVERVDLTWAAHTGEFAAFAILR
ncbi:MAG: acylphosphatase [Desulfobacterales bacterium]|jgi:acylphosphatase|nr:acylphosphatase [Desulfobacterales bacterium]